MTSRKVPISNTFKIQTRKHTIDVLSGGFDDIILRVFCFCFDSSAADCCDGAGNISTLSGIHVPVGPLPLVACRFYFSSTLCNACNVCNVQTEPTVGDFIQIICCCCCCCFANAICTILHRYRQHNAPTPYGNEARESAFGVRCTLQNGMTWHFPFFVFYLLLHQQNVENFRFYSILFNSIF